MASKKSETNKSKNGDHRIVLWIVLFAVVAMLVIGISRATSGNSSFEAEQASRQGVALRQNDNSASNRDWIEFGVGSPSGGDIDPIASNFNVNQWIRPAWGDGRLPSSSSDGGNFRFACGFSHLLYDDPIVKPGEPGGSHLHMFFGNLEADANSTYQSLRTSGQGSCSGGPINRSAYWIPAMLDGSGNKVVVPVDSKIYYKVAKNRPNVEELPAGIKLIGGWDSQNPNVGGFGSFVCKTTVDGAGSVIRSGNTIVDCPAGNYLQTTIGFGHCWDGKNLDSANHRSHVSNYSRDANQSCTSQHPVNIPRIQFIIIWQSDGNTGNWRLSSDRPGDPGGFTYHADWLGAWDPGVLTQLTDTCMNQRLSCVGAEIGRGDQLLNFPTNGLLQPGAKIDVPAKP